MKGICGFIFLVLIGCSVVQGQSSIVNSTLKDIKNFQVTSVTTLTTGFNALFTDVYGHFFRSQSTLRIARQSIFAAASKFPYHTLTTETRQQLVNTLTALLIKCIDPTVDYLQKESMLRFFNFMKDENNAVEKTFKAAATQLEEVSAAVSSSSNDDCLRKENINRRLSVEYSSFTTAINECTRNISIEYRPSINEFTRAHFVALPLLNRITIELNRCGNNGNNRESCVTKFLATYCEDETCKVCSTVTAVQTQAETMVNSAQEKYDQCLKTAESKIPATTPFVENINKCVEPLATSSENSDVVREEGGDSNNVDF